MGDISTNFSRSEFACKCQCGFDTVDTELLEILEIIRAKFDARVTVNSGCRCRKYNTKIKGSKQSKHMEGRAADIVIEGVSPASVQAYAMTLWPDKFGIGCYDSFTHLDARSGHAARWQG